MLNSKINLYLQETFCLRDFSFFKNKSWKQFWNLTNKTSIASLYLINRKLILFDILMHRSLYNILEKKITTWVCNTSFEKKIMFKRSYKCSTFKIFELLNTRSYIYIYKYYIYTHTYIYYSICPYNDGG